MHVGHVSFRGLVGPEALGNLSELGSQRRCIPVLAQAVRTTSDVSPKPIFRVFASHLALDHTLEPHPSH